MSIKHSVTIWRMRARHSSRISMWDNSDTTRKPLRAGPARVRYYDPNIGRFISQDPIRDGANWYEYCGNNPVNGIDPTGLSEEQLSKLQRATLNRALGYLAIVSPAYHRDIVAFRAAHGIKYDPEENGGATYWLFGWHMCIGSKFADTNLAPLPLKHSVDTSYEGDAFWGYRMAATLVHENTHVQQGKLSHSGTKAEIQAYQSALNFLGSAFDTNVGLYSVQSTIANVYKTYLGDTYAWADENGVKRGAFGVRDDILNVLGNPADIKKKL